MTCSFVTCEQGSTRLASISHLNFPKRGNLNFGQRLVAAKFTWHYDQVCVFEAPDDETAASVLLSADMLGNIRTQTLRAFTSDEMEKILANIP